MNEKKSCADCLYRAACFDNGIKKDAAECEVFVSDAVIREGIAMLDNIRNKVAPLRVGGEDNQIHPLSGTSRKQIYRVVRAIKRMFGQI